MPRILVGDFGAIEALGLQQILDEVGFDVAVRKSDELVMEIAELLPDGIILNLDTEDGLRMAQHIASMYPALTMVLCSPERAVMRVYPRFHHGESYVSRLTPALLVQAVSS